MRKALMGLIMAATAITPIAAQAQDRPDDGRAARMRDHYQRLERRNQQRHEARQERQEQRAGQAEARVDRSQGQLQRSDVASERSRGARGELMRSETAGERSMRAWGDRQRIERSAAVQSRLQSVDSTEPVLERRPRRSPGVTLRSAPSIDEPVQQTQTVAQTERSSAYPDAWQGNPNSRMRRHYERLEQRNQDRYGDRSTGGHDHDDHDHDHDTDSHRDLHRDFRREHRDLHASDPTRREHRQWHRDAERDHRQIHRDEHRDLHASDPTRREHRRWHRQWDHNWRRNSRYDWASWRWRNHSLFRLSPYYSPYWGHRYSRFSAGYFLPSLFYGQNYWLDDPWQYRLPPAPPGTRWVRYYNDVLLVDTFTGEVVDVIYNFFW